MTYKSVMKKRIYMREYMRAYRLRTKEEPAQLPIKETAQELNPQMVKNGGSS